MNTSPLFSKNRLQQQPSQPNTKDTHIFAKPSFSSASSNILPFSLSQHSHLLCPQFDSCYLAPSGGLFWPAVSPVFCHCWFRLEARMLPLARGMSSRLVLIIPHYFKGKPARHAEFTNASCKESLVSCSTSGKS